MDTATRLGITAIRLKEKFAEKFCCGLAWWLPKRLCYWVFIRVAVHGTGSKYPDQILPELTIVEAAERWRKDKLPERV